MRNRCGGPLGHPRHRSKWECLRAEDRWTEKRDGLTDKWKRENRRKGALKKNQRTPRFTNNDSSADRKRCLSCCNIHVSDRTQGGSGLLHYLGKKRERVEIIKNASEIMHFSDSIHHTFGTLDPLREVSECSGWGPGACYRSNSQKGGRLIELCCSLRT